MFANKLKWVHLVVPSPFETLPFHEKKQIKPGDERKIILPIVNFNMQSSGARSGNKKCSEIARNSFILGAPSDAKRI